MSPLTRMDLNKPITSNNLGLHQVMKAIEARHLRAYPKLSSPLILKGAAQKLNKSTPASMDTAALIPSLNRSPVANSTTPMQSLVVITIAPRTNPNLLSAVHRTVQKLKPNREPTVKGAALKPNKNRVD